MMKKLFKILGKILLAIVVILLVAGIVKYFMVSNTIKNNYALLGKEAPTLVIDQHEFRDLNKNGQLDVYEDVRADINDRVNDLVNQMTLEEKAGSMFITMIGMRDNGDPIDKPFFSSSPFDFMFFLAMPSSSEMIAQRKMNSFNIVHSYEADVLASFNNKIQKLSERQRLGIPTTIATDPRHGTESNPGAALYTPSFSQWPTSLGLAATRDTTLVKEFGEIARAEYLTTGIRLALHPMADLATEPRWGRTNGTFGEDAHLSAQMTKAYILGFQGDSLGSHSVATMTKHFSGGGPQEDGEDAHFGYGKNQVYPGNNFDYHLIPFEEGAFPAKTAQIMPYYGIPIGQTDEDVAFAFNKQIITTLLREKYNFDGVVCTDWNIISGSSIGPARSWGVEDLTPLQRAKKVLDAGCDQFGGESSTDLIIELVKSGEISEERLDISVKRIMRDKFKLGLFDNPYVDEKKAKQVAGSEAFRTKGEIAQAKSTILLKNEQILPLSKNIKVFADGMKNPEALSAYATLVETPQEADVIVIRITTPFEPRSDEFLEQFFHQGRLYHSKEELNEILSLVNQKPTIVVANLERPAILTEINNASKAFLVEFGTSDEILADILFGIHTPSGKLPFELPSSQEAVENQKEDVPYDSKDPLYAFGAGITYN